MGYLEDLLEESKKASQAKAVVKEEKAAPVVKQEETTKSAGAIKQAVSTGQAGQPTQVEEAGEIKIAGAKTLITGYGSVKIFKVEGSRL